MSTPKLTKKQRKSIAHRDRHKNKTSAVDPDNDIPELEIQDTPIDEVQEPVSHLESKKRKLHEDADQVDPPHSKRPKTTDNEAEKPKKSKTKGRFILFVGMIKDLFICMAKRTG